jgi:hypothetical protein
MDYLEIKNSLEFHYLGKSNGKRTLAKYLSELESLKYLNIEIPTPVEVDGPCQVLEEFNDGYLLRIYHFRTYWDTLYGKLITELVENYRCFFGKSFGDSQLLIRDQYGKSTVNGYRYPRQMQGYHQDNFAYSTPLKFINKTDLFPYINFDGLKIVGMRLMEYFYSGVQSSNIVKSNVTGQLRDVSQDIIKARECEYTLELLIKSGRKRLAELYVNECYASDIKKLLKQNPQLLKKPTAERIRLAAALGDIKYQTGMIQFNDSPYFHPGTKIKELLNYCKWNKFYQYIKTQYKFRVGLRQINYLNDFIDYRNHNLEFGLPDFPKNLYDAKEVLQEQLDNKKTQEDIERAKIYEQSIQERTKELFNLSYKGFVIFPAPSPKALIEEGKTMHHCVSNYTKKYAEGECDIYFLRLESAPDESLVTVEIKNGKLVQARAKHNQNPPKIVMPIINKLVNKYDSARA